jgi:hypothetical protein
LAIGYQIVDPRLCQIAYEQLLHDSQSLYTDIETLVCNIVHIFDRIKMGNVFYADINDVIKGLRIKNEITSQTVQDLYKEAINQ